MGTIWFLNGELGGAHFLFGPPVSLLLRLPRGTFPPPYFISFSLMLPELSHSRTSLPQLTLIFPFPNSLSLSSITLPHFLTYLVPLLPLQVQTRIIAPWKPMQKLGEIQQASRPPDMG